MGMPFDEGQEQVAAAQFDLQLFADEVAEISGEVGNVDTGESADVNTDNDTVAEDESADDVADSGTVDQEETPE